MYIAYVHMEKYFVTFISLDFVVAKKNNLKRRSHIYIPVLFLKTCYITCRDSFVIHTKNGILFQWQNTFQIHFWVNSYEIKDHLIMFSSHIFSRVSNNRSINYISETTLSMKTCPQSLVRVKKDLCVIWLYVNEHFQVSFNFPFTHCSCYAIVVQVLTYSPNIHKNQTSNNRIPIVIKQDNGDRSG